MPWTFAGQLSRHIIIGGVLYWTYGGIYYQLGDDGCVVLEAPFVRVLPRHYTVVVIHGIAYYVADDIYYRPAPGSYVMVERPVEAGAKVAVPAPEPGAGTITLYVPKKDSDGFTSVVLKKIDGAFLGPQGEFYPMMPSVAHLAEMYGVTKEAAKTDDTVVHVQVPKKNGQGTVDVALKRHEQGYLGPQGEFYPQMPSAGQLTEVYGAD